MRHILTTLIALFLVFNPLAALSQTTLLVDYDKAEFRWTWTKGTGGDVNEWDIACGGSTVTITDPAARSYPVSQVVATPGIYKGCTLVAKNGFGPSNPGMFPDFHAGRVPSDPTGTVVVVPVTP